MNFDYYSIWLFPDANVQAQEVFSEIVMREKAKELKPEVDVLTTSINSKTSSEITSKINVVTQKTSKEVVEMTTEVFDDKLESRQLELNESLNDLKVKRDILENELMELQVSNNFCCLFFIVFLSISNLNPLPSTFT